MNYFRRTDRADEVLFGVMFLALAAFLGYFGIRGLILFLGGSRAAPADPLAFTIGIVSSIALCYLTLRLWGRAGGSRPSLPNAVLLIGSLGCFAGMVWMMGLNYELHGSAIADLRIVVAPGGVGVLGLIQWWRRVRKQDKGNEGNVA